jgi:integrase
MTKARLVQTTSRSAASSHHTEDLQDRGAQDQCIPADRRLAQAGDPAPARARKRQIAQRLRLGEAWREHGLVSASTIGTPIEPRNINRRWDELRQRAGLDGLRLHDLRHGCATFMLAAGMPSRAIMEVLGHSGISVTMNTYAHVLPVLRQEAADAIDELFGA